MKKYRYTVLVITALLVCQVSLMGQGNLKLEVINFMKEYEKYSSFTKDGLSYEKDYETKFRGLFVSSSIHKNIKDYQVFNDLEDSVKQAYIKKEKYVSNVKLIFPSKGINVSINIIEIGKEKKQKKKNNYNVEVLVRKKLFGLNNLGRIYQKEFELTFLLNYNFNKNIISNIKIVSITTKGYPREPSGFFIGLNLQPSFTGIATKDFLNENNTYGDWSQSGKITFNGGVEFNYYFDNPLLGFGARINYTSYQSTFSLDSYSQTPVSMIDINEDDYYLFASGNTYKETVQLNYIEIPVFVKFRFVLHNTKFLNHIYINMGPVFSFTISNTISTNGIFTYEGYYPDYHVVLHDIKEYDYYTDKEFGSTPESKLKSLNISGLAEIGLNIPLSGEKLNMNISIIYQRGLLNVSDGNDDYVMTKGYNKNNAIIDSRSNVSTGLFGINIGILYKIF